MIDYIMLLAYNNKYIAINLSFVILFKLEKRNIYKRKKIKQVIRKKVILMMILIMNRLKIFF